jgi:hypothetical protein
LNHVGNEGKDDYKYARIGQFFHGRVVSEHANYLLAAQVKYGLDDGEQNQRDNTHDFEVLIGDGDTTCSDLLPDNSARCRLNTHWDHEDNGDQVKKNRVGSLIIHAYEASDDAQDVERPTFGEQHDRGWKRDTQVVSPVSEGVLVRPR